MALTVVARCVSARRPYRSDVSDARWALIEPVFTAWRTRRTGPGAAARVHDLREIVNAILYVNRTGIPWEYPPHDFPPYKTVYDYYAKWKADGTTQQVHDLLRDYEALPQRSRAMIHWAMANKMSRELTGESTSTRRIETNMTVITA